MASRWISSGLRWCTCHKYHTTPHFLPVTDIELFDTIHLMMAPNCINERFLVDADDVCCYECSCITDLVPTEDGVLCLEHALLRSGHSEKTVAQRLEKYRRAADTPSARAAAEFRVNETAAARALQQTAASSAASTDGMALLCSALIACKCMAHNSAMASNITYKLGNILPIVLRTRRDLAPIFEAYGWTGTQFMGPLDASALNDILSLVNEREELMLPDTIPLTAVSTGTGLPRRITGSKDPDYESLSRSVQW